MPPLHCGGRTCRNSSTHLLNAGVPWLGTVLELLRVSVTRDPRVGGATGADPVPVAPPPVPVLELVPPFVPVPLSVDVLGPVPVPVGGVVLVPVPVAELPPVPLPVPEDVPTARQQSNTLPTRQLLQSNTHKVNGNRTCTVLTIAKVARRTSTNKKPTLSQRKAKSEMQIRTKAPKIHLPHVKPREGGGRSVHGTPTKHGASKHRL